MRPLEKKVHVRFFCEVIALSRDSRHLQQAKHLGGSPCLEAGDQRGRPAGADCQPELKITFMSDVQSGGLVSRAARPTRRRRAR